MSQQEGTLDITLERSRLGEIIAVNAFHKGDSEYDRRTGELEQSNWKYASSTSYTINALQQQVIEFTETADNVAESR